MTGLTFNTILEERLRKTRQSLEAKAGEYASTQDRLHNFKAAASMLRCSPAEALLGMLVKHLVSVVDIVKKGGANEAVVNEKLGDSINYLILLEAILREKSE